MPLTFFSLDIEEQSSLASSDEEFIDQIQRLRFTNIFLQTGRIAKYHIKFFSCESHKQSCIATRFFGKKVTHEKMPSYMINRVFLHESLSLNVMVFRMILILFLKFLIQSTNRLKCIYYLKYAYLSRVTSKCCVCVHLFFLLQQLN